MYRLQGTTYSSVGTLAPTDSRISYSAPSFLQNDGTTTSSVYFYERGSASKGSVVVVRSGSSKQYTVNVAGLTARVSYS